MTFRQVRISILLALLALVLVWGAREIHRRQERTRWERTLSVAIVILRIGAVDASAIEALEQRVPALEERLRSEHARYRSTGLTPFDFQSFGPLDVTEPPPAPDGEGFFELAAYAWRLWRYARHVDELAGVESGAFDARIYLVVRPPASGERLSVEGLSQQGGKIGSVEVELDRTMADFALFVVTHELFHTLGANDKYDASGHALVPDGLADPRRRPLHPQLGAEVMARNVVVAPGVERPPESIAELVVGARTAEEVGWCAPPSCAQPGFH